MAFAICGVILKDRDEEPAGCRRFGLGTHQGENHQFGLLVGFTGGVVSLGTPVEWHASQALGVGL